MKNKDPFGFYKAINWNKLNDTKVLKKLEDLIKDKLEDLFKDSDDEGNTAIIKEDRIKTNH